MAFAGHKFTQTPHAVHSTTSMSWGLRFLPSSSAPCGQTPMQMSPAHDVHLEASMETGGFFGLPMRVQRLNKRQEYIVYVHQ